MRGSVARARGAIARHPGLAAFAGAALCGVLVLSVAHVILPPSPRAVVRVVPTATSTVTGTPTATPIPFARPEFEAGVTYPQWGVSAYGPADAAWAQGVADIRQQTGARWLGMVVDLYQNGYDSTDVFAGTGTPTPANLAAGIETARAQGFQVFVFPILTVLNVSNDWGANVHFSDPARSAAWFAGYWKALQPYAAAAAQAGAAQLSIGHEYGGMETAPADQWQGFIQEVHAVFPGTLTYDINWSTLWNPVQSWMRDPLISYIGVSEYMPLTNGPHALTIDQMRVFWSGTLLPLLDALSDRCGKPVLLAEIGYRNTTDALYQPWIWQSAASASPQQQADAYGAAARAAFSDRHVGGIFFYAWENGQFAPSAPAVTTLHDLYLSPAA